MTASLVSAVIVLITTCSPIFAQSNSGDRSAERTALARAAQSSPNSVAAWAAYAEFLDRYGDSGARDAYTKLLAAARASGDTAKAAAVAHRVALFEWEPPFHITRDT